MTFQMYLLEHEMEAEERGLAQGIERGRNEGAESIALKLIHRGRPLDEIHEDTGLPLHRLEQLANNTSIA